MFYIKPDAVNLSVALPEENPDKPGSFTRDITATEKTISQTGAWGNPTFATYEKCEIAVHVLKSLLQSDLQRFIAPTAV